MPRRRPAQVRVRQPIRRRRPEAKIRQVPGVSPPTLRAIVELERTRLWPGAIAEALDGWTRFVHGPVRVLDDYEPEECSGPECQWEDGAVRRRTLRAALHALPTRAARELRALVHPLDETYLARSIPTPGSAPIRGLLTTAAPQTGPDGAAERTFTIFLDLKFVGWLLVVVGDGHGQVRFTASYLTNALDDLLAALLALTRGEQHARVSWEGEPTEYRWNITIDAFDYAHVRVLVFPDPCAEQPIGGHQLLDVDLPLPMLIGSVTAAARDLLTRRGTDGYARQWHAGPFPIDQLLALEQWLRHQDPGTTQHDRAT